MTSLVLMITTSSARVFYAPEHFQPLRLPQWLMTVHLLPEALNSTTRQGTIAKCLEHSTSPSVPLFLACHQTHGQIAALNPPFATCSSKILMQFSTTMWLNTPYTPANLSCSQATILRWQEFLSASWSFWLIPMPAHPIHLFFRVGWGRRCAPCSWWSMWWPLSHLLVPACLIQDCDQHNLHLDNRPWPTHLHPRITKLQMSSPRKKVTYAHESVPLGAASAKLLTGNLQAHTLPDKSPFETKAIWWYRGLLLNQNGEVDYMIGVENGILVAYGMCPPCELPCSVTWTKNLSHCVTFIP